jgi:hypothetical protein
MIDFLEFIGAVSLLTLFFVLAGIVLRRRVLEGKILQGLRPWYLLIAPPRDLYAQVFYKPVDGNKVEDVYKQRVVHRYVGLYELSLEAPHLGLAMEGKVDLDLGIEAEGRFFRDGQLIYSNSFKYSASEKPPMRNLTCLTGGIRLFGYSIPEDLPQGIPVDCEITLRFLNDKFKDVHKNGLLVITKMSEK